MTAIFLLAAIVTALCALASNLMTPKPATWRAWARAWARLGVFASCLAAAARVMTEGAGVDAERVALMVCLAVLYLVQVRCEVLRHQRTIDETDQAGA
ncbi:hypothetical protein LJR143_002196 [Pseudoxanthomonas sp. LjRoot143]|uniref:hypothetical protein n=1 Tax=Pseudoxanthomonas sp. LjRoot143 TaxID=3342266 RepID=UPI003ECF17D5